MKDLEVLPGLSDHEMCKFKLEIEYDKPRKEKFKFRKLNWTGQN